MAVQDQNVYKTASFARECIRLVMGSTSVSQADVEFDEVTPGFAFEIVRVEAYATAVTATASVTVKIGTTAALASAITPVAGTATAGTLATATADRRGSATDVIRGHYTTNGSGVVTNGRIAVWIRPVPLQGEAYSV